MRRAASWRLDSDLISRWGRYFPPNCRSTDRISSRAPFHRSIRKRRGSRERPPTRAPQSPDYCRPCRSRVPILPAPASSRHGPWQRRGLTPRARRRSRTGSRVPPDVIVARGSCTNIPHPIAPTTMASRRPSREAATIMLAVAQTNAIKQTRPTTIPIASQALDDGSVSGDGRPAEPTSAVVNPTPNSELSHCDHSIMYCSSLS